MYSNLSEITMLKKKICVMGWISILASLVFTLQLISAGFTRDSQWFYLIPVTIGLMYISSKMTTLEIVK